MSPRVNFSGLRRVLSAEFVTMPIRDAIGMLRHFESQGYTHARFTVSKWEPKPPRMRKQKANPLESSEPGVPGKIRPNGTPGKIRRVPT